MKTRGSSKTAFGVWPRLRLAVTALAFGLYPMGAVWGCPLDRKTSEIGSDLEKTSQLKFWQHGQPCKEEPLRGLQWDSRDCIWDNGEVYLRISFGSAASMMAINLKQTKVTPATTLGFKVIASELVVKILEINGPQPLINEIQIQKALDGASPTYDGRDGPCFLTAGHSDGKLSFHLVAALRRD